MTTNLFPQEITTAVEQAAAATDTGFYATTAPITKYVATTGSDTTGDGTVSHPYATVDRAYQDIPRIIKHKCKILVAAGSYASGWPTSIDPTFYDDGSLAFIGVGVPTVVSGPHTITGVADLGAGGQRLTIGAGGLGAADSLCGQTVMTLAGSSVPGSAYHVVSNTANSIDLVLNSVKPLNADTFNLVTPAASIATDGCTFFYDDHGVDEDGLSSWNRDRLIIHNIFLDASASTKTLPIFSFASAVGYYGCPFLDFVYMKGPSAPAWAVYFVGVTNTPLNGWYPQSIDYIVDGATGIANLNQYYGGKPGLSINGSTTRTDDDILSVGTCDISDVVAFGRVWVDNGRTNLQYCGAGKTTTFLGGSLGLYSSLVIGVAGSQAVDAKSGTTDIYNTHIDKGTYAVYARRGAMVHLEGVTCSATTITVSAASIGALCRVRQVSALPNFIGATAGQKAYIFSISAGPVKSDTWLVSGGATDSLGAFLAYGE